VCAACSLSVLLSELLSELLSDLLRVIRPVPVRIPPDQGVRAVE
jgi:hypothetical protein